MDPPGMIKLFAVFGTSAILGGIILIFTILFVTDAELGGGLVWSDKSAIFNFHPLFMVIGFILLYGNGAVAYRVFNSTMFNRYYVKCSHAAMNLLALIFAIVGVTAVFLFHARNGFPDMYSMHSWLGIMTFGLFGLQWVAGFVTFLYPGMPQTVRATLLPIHSSLGIGLICFIGMSVLTGIQEKAGFIFGKNYGKHPPGFFIINFLGFFVALYILNVIYLLTSKEFKPEPQANAQEPDTIQETFH